MVNKVIDDNGREHNIKDLQESYRSFPSYSYKNIDDNGEPYLSDIVFKRNGCECDIVGNGTLQFPLQIKYCDLHEKGASLLGSIKKSLLEG